MQPLPEVRAAAEQLGRLDDVDLLTGLCRLADVASSLVPSCVGVSLTVMVDGSPYTLTATSEELALVDAGQYLDGGPCVDAATTATEVAVADVLDESAWGLFARVAAARGVRSSLSLPIGAGPAQVPGAINLYASDPGAFDERGQVLAAAFGVPVQELVRDADLSFATREQARELPQRLADKATVDAAVGLLAGQLRCTPDEARDRLRHASAQAGVGLLPLAQALLDLHDERSPD